MAKNAFNKRRELVIFKKIERIIEEEGNYDSSLKRLVVCIGNLNIKKTRKR